MTKRLWFKRKRYGWGWFPATWEGWLVTIIAMVLVLLVATSFDAYGEEAHVFWLSLIFISITLIRICYAKGEKPKWSWGN